MYLTALIAALGTLLAPRIHTKGVASKGQWAYAAWMDAQQTEEVLKDNCSTMDSGQLDSLTST